MGGGHHHTPKVPDWRSYKIENAPELVQTQRALASVGLKDPWLRNEVWKYDKNVWTLTEGQRIRGFLFRGFKWGLLAAIATVAIEKALAPADDGHGHAHH